MAPPAVLFIMVFGFLPTVHHFLVETNGQQNGGGNSSQAEMVQRIDHLQAQLHIQNKTLETQGGIIEQLLNISRQTPSVQSLSSDLSVLHSYVQRIMDEYQRLSQIANTTELALKINNMVDSIRILTTSFTHQEKVDLEFKRRMDTLNATLMGALPIANRISRLETSLLSFNHSISTLSSLTNTNHKQLITMTNDLHNVKNNVSTLQGALGHQASSQMSTKLASLKVEFDSAKRDLQNLQSVESTDNQYARRHVSSLSSKYTSLSSLVREIEKRFSTLEHNLEEEVLSDIRLVDGDYTGEGRLEVEYHDRWGTVCDDSFTDSSAKVACRQLGFDSQHAVYKDEAPYGEGSGDIVLDNVVCTGDERSLAVCRHNGFTLEDCAHSEDVGVICFDIRLVGGRSSREGRVEVKVGDDWGTVCDDSWDDDDARVVCRTLGYPTGSAAAFTRAHFGEGTGPVLMDNVACTGSERSLALCPFRGFGQENCDHDEDAGVTCH